MNSLAMSRSLRRPYLLLTALALALSACTTTTAPSPVTAPAPTGGVVPADWNPPPVTPARAVQLFEAVCGASLPNFASATSRMAANGITLTSAIGTSTRYSATEEVSFKIIDGPGLGKSCSMVFQTSGSPASLRSAVNALGPSADTAMGRAILYRGRNVIVTLEPASSNGLSRLLMLSER
jgi:hypothetical protein